MLDKVLWQLAVLSLGILGDRSYAQCPYTYRISECAAKTSRGGGCVSISSSTFLV